MVLKQDLTRRLLNFLKMIAAFQIMLSTLLSRIKINPLKISKKIIKQIIKMANLLNYQEQVLINQCSETDLGLKKPVESLNKFINSTTRCVKSMQGLKLKNK